MYTIKYLERNGFGTDVSKIYKDEPFQDMTIFNLCSTLGVEALLGNTLFHIGKQTIEIVLTGNRGDEGIRELNNSAMQIVDIAVKELPEMSLMEKAFYSHFIYDYNKNGFVLPHIVR